MFINVTPCILLKMCYCFPGSASAPISESSQTRSHWGPQYHPELCRRWQFSSVPFVMGHLGTSVISNEGWIAQGAEHPEYQVEGLLQAGCESFDVTTVASPEAALHLQGRAGGASPQNCLWLIQYQLSQGYIAGHPPDFTKCSGCHLMRVKLKTSLMTPVLADLPLFPCWPLLLQPCWSLCGTPRTKPSQVRNAKGWMLTSISRSKRHGGRLECTGRNSSTSSGRCSPTAACWPEENTYWDLKINSCNALPWN